MSSLNSKVHILKVPEGQFFDVSVKHYRALDEGLPSECKRVTLFLAHGIGLHKELFEPFLCDLKDLQTKSAQTVNTVVADAWAIDCPNHGDSSLLNEKKLVSNNRFTSPQDHAEAFLALMDSGLIPDVASRRIVLVGHSAGATTAVFCAAEIIKRGRPDQFSSLILLEPPTISTPLISVDDVVAGWKRRSPLYTKLINARKDKFPTKKDALEQFRKSLPYGSWDKRALELYVEHGLRPLPSGFYPENKTGFTLKCYKLHEGAGFARDEDVLGLSNYLPSVCHATQVHLVCAEKSAFRPGLKDLALMSERKSAKYPCAEYASVRLAPNAGHFIVQEMPAEAAMHVLDALNAHSRITQSKL
ncbi:hypothetical protein M0805_009401 [Coniferiporia weirii]|nr:hypothetical protein M0805_009401 [Coniferiporia weirii]